MSQFTGRGGPNVADPYRGLDFYKLPRIKEGRVNLGSLAILSF